MLFIRPPAVSVCVCTEQTELGEDFDVEDHTYGQHLYG